MKHDKQKKFDKQGASHPDTARRITNEPARRRISGPVAMAVLAVGAICIMAACGAGGSGQAHPATAGSNAAPTLRASQTSAPASTRPTSAPATSGNSTVVASAAGAAQVAHLTSVALHDHGGLHVCAFTSANTLTDVKVTNNGWALARVGYKQDSAQGPAMVFKLVRGAWAEVDCGEDFSGDNIPSDVYLALFR
jgi:hypothetical protein